MLLRRHVTHNLGSPDRPLILVCVFHKVDRLFLQSAELEPPPNPSPFGSGGGTHSLGGEGLGGV